MIYKREPIIHRLPGNWNNMDAVKFNNINSIQGLQHIDNTLAANQNSTYDCKNVYQDESGNLTVRPSLRFLKSALPLDRVFHKDLDVALLKYYSTSTNKIFHCYIENKYVITDFYNYSYEIGEGNITVQESDGITYILYQDTDNKLKFHKLVDNKLVDVEPDIPANIKDNNISRLYNLLSDKTKYQTLDIVDSTVTDKYFDNVISSSISAANINYITDIRILKNNDILVVRRCSDNESGFIEIYGIRNEKFTLITKSGTDGNGTLSWYCVDNSKDTHSITVTVAWYDDSSNIAYSLNIETHYIDLLNSNNSSKIVNEIKGFGAGSGAGIFNIAALPKGEVLAFIDYADKSDDTRYVLRRLPGSDSVTISPGSDYYGANLYACSKGFVCITDTVSETKAYIFEYDKQLSAGLDSVVSVKLDIPGDDAYILSTEDDIVIIEAETGRAYYNFSTKGWNSIKDYIPLRDGNKRRPVTIQYDVINIGANSTNTVLTQWSLKRDTVTVYDIPITSYVHANTESTIYIAVNELNGILDIVYRDRIPIDVYIDRPVSDNFPVLSEIEDTVLTSFYLDNIYWFVTKHRVFGTGVANEQFSIKYFDPRKYFHFDENITGAIRISDSSFWVFHNKGAYLIYKSTAQVYDELSNDYIEMITWLCTNTAESKGCDFDNGLVTLPVSNYIASVTSDDISFVQMRENVQTDDRILVPMTLDIQKFVSTLLNETESIVTGVFKYNALFFLNPANKKSTTPILVYNTTTQSWWYWEIPVNSVNQVTTTENNIEILAHVDGRYAIYDLFTEYYDYRIGGVTWKLYADRLINNEPSKIDWFWKSAILHFGTVDYKKQLLFTNFIFSESDATTLNFEYNFEVYDKEYSDGEWTDVTQVVERTKSYSCKSIIAKFMCIQLYLKSADTQNLECYTRPKFNAISFKYRVLYGGLL